MRKPNNYLFILIAGILVIAASSCKKGKSLSPKKTDTTVTTFHIDNTLSTSFYNRSLFFAQQVNNPGQFQSVGSTAAGPGVYSVSAFNYLTITKTGVTNLHTYQVDSPSQFDAVQATSADADAGGNIWVGGYVVRTLEGASKPFVVKLDPDGNVLVTKAFLKKDNQNENKSYKVDVIKVLKNGDIFVLLVSAYDMQVMRMSSDGTVLWDKEYAETNASVFGLSQGHNRYVEENSQGDIFFLSTQINIPNGGTCLTRIKANGDVVYAVNYNLTYDYYSQMKFLSSGSLLFYTQWDEGALRTPYWYKINPDNGALIAAKSAIIGNAQDPTMTDMVEVNNQLKFALTYDNYYILMSMDENLNVLGEKIVLAMPAGEFLPGALAYSASDKALYHFSDQGSPAPGSFCQFLRTDVNGGGLCHVYTTMPFQIAPVDNSANAKATPATLTVTTDTPGDQPLIWVNNTLSPKNADGCSE